MFLGSLSDWSDQYSLAITYYALRAGRFPFPPIPKDAARSYTRPPPDLSGVTEVERPSLLRALAPIPTNRFPNCREFMTALLKSLGLRVEKVDDESHQVRVVRDGAPVKPGSKLHQRRLSG